jgi:hypothetical protein
MNNHTISWIIILFDEQSYCFIVMFQVYKNMLLHRLWASCEPLRRHVLKIVRPYIFRDVYRFEIPPNRNIVPAFEIPIPRGFFYLFLCFIPKITQPTSRNQKLHFET